MLKYNCGADRSAYTALDRSGTVPGPPLLQLTLGITRSVYLHLDSAYHDQALTLLC